MKEKILKLPQPRTLKTHLSYEMLPKEIQQKKPKVWSSFYLSTWNCTFRIITTRFEIKFWAMKNILSKQFEDKKIGSITINVVAWFSYSGFNKQSRLQALNQEISSLNNILLFFRLNVIW